MLSGDKLFAVDTSLQVYYEDNNTCIGHVLHLWVLDMPENYPCFPPYMDVVQRYQDWVQQQSAQIPINPSSYIVITGHFFSRNKKVPSQAHPSKLDYGIFYAGYSFHYLFNTHPHECVCVCDFVWIDYRYCTWCSIYAQLLACQA